jgi:hypothetical protein
MLMGFFDDGKSFEDGLQILDNQYGVLEWLSPQTKQLISEEEEILMS